MLGRYVSGHPLDGCEHELAAASYATLSEIQDAEPSELRDGTLVTTAGMLSGLHRRQRGKNIWLAGEFEDTERSIEFQMWMDEWREHFDHVHPFRPVVIDAWVKRPDDRPMTLVLHRVELLRKHEAGCLCEPTYDPDWVDPPELTDEARERLWRLEAEHEYLAA